MPHTAVRVKSASNEVDSIRIWGHYDDMEWTFRQQRHFSTRIWKLRQHFTMSAKMIYLTTSCNNMYTVKILFTGAFLYVHFCDLSLQHWFGKKNLYCTWPWNLATILLFSPLKSYTRGSWCTQNYLWTSDWYSPVCNAFDAGKSITWASGRGLALELSIFLGPKWHGSMPFHRAQKSLYLT